MYINFFIKLLVYLTLQPPTKKILSYLTRKMSTFFPILFKWLAKTRIYSINILLSKMLGSNTFEGLSSGTYTNNSFRDNIILVFREKSHQCKTVLMENFRQWCFVITLRHPRFFNLKRILYRICFACSQVQMYYSNPIGILVQQRL